MLAYLDHLRVERGLAANTLSSYRRDLRRYAAFLADQGVDDAAGVEEAEVSGFLMRLREGDADHVALGPGSAARAVVAVRGFHRFVLREGLSATDPAKGVRPPAPPKRLPKALGLAEVERLLDVAGRAGTALALRDRALLELLYGTGARISEAVGLDVDDLDLDSGVVRLRGKGSKERMVPVGSYASSAVGAYLTRARPTLATVAAGSAQRRSALFFPWWAAVPAECLDGAPQDGQRGRPDRGGVAAHPQALVRHPPARRGRGRPRGPGIVGSRLCYDHSGVHIGHHGHTA